MLIANSSQRSLFSLNKRTRFICILLLSAFSSFLHFECIENKNCSTLLLFLFLSLFRFFSLAFIFVVVHSSINILSYTRITFHKNSSQLVINVYLNHPRNLWICTYTIPSEWIVSHLFFFHVVAGFFSWLLLLLCVLLLCAIAVFRDTKLKSKMKKKRSGACIQLSLYSISLLLFNMT